MEGRAGESGIDCGSCTFFLPSGPLAPELPLSLPLADGTNEPLYAAARYRDTETKLFLLAPS